MRGGNEIIPTRRSLLIRLKNWDDQEAWRAFFDTYWKLIYNAAIRAGLNEAEAQDVVQETVIGISRRIPEFVYDPAKGSFKTWLMRQTTWRIAGQLRKRLPVEAAPATPRTAGRTTAMERVPDPAIPALESLWDEEWENNLLDAAFRRVRSKVDAKQLQIYDLCVRKRWPASKVAQDLRVGTARVYLAKHRVGNLLKKELLDLKRKPI
jgi:RNA polymerase sigma-70 factor (ECF subfamily)